MKRPHVFVIVAFVVGLGLGFRVISGLEGTDGDLDRGRRAL